MTDRDQYQPKGVSVSTTEQYIIKRSAVPQLPSYVEYREHLRFDFFYSCAYCTLSEFEAQGIRFTIDHYEPQSERPDLENEYSNLFYACDECNRLKSDLSPPDTARAAGYRFFRSDEDIYPDHFHSDNFRVKPMTNVGDFTVEALELNRQSLRRLREIRDRLQKSDDFISHGVLALRHYKIDQLPKDIRARALKAIGQMDHVVEEIAESIDLVLKQAAKSPLIDDDPEKSETRVHRSQKLSTWQGMHPGIWRGRRKKQATR